jgi:hypothetical protein
VSRRDRGRTEGRLVAGGWLIVALLGGGLVALFYGGGAGAVAVGVVALAVGLGGLLWLLLSLLQRWASD